MKKLFLTTLLFVLSRVTNAQDTIASYIDNIAASELKKNHGLALVIGVNVDGKERIFTYGETEKGNGQKPNANSIFEIGQVTQVFTCALFAEMSIRGEINPDEPIRKFLPVDVPAPVYQEIICEPVTQTDYVYEKGYSIQEKYTRYVCKPDRSSKPQPILLCYLSTHSSGLPEKPGNLKKNPGNPYAGYTRENMYDFLRGYALPKPIGYDFHYSDLNMALLGHILELKKGKPYETLLDSMLLSKLDMNNTAKSLTENQAKKMLSGHSAKGKPAGNWTYDIMAPSGALHSDMEDMMKLLSINISPGNSELKNVFDYTHNPRIRFTDKKYGTTETGLGWLIRPLNKGDKKYVSQEGITGGFSSFVGFVETSRTGVVILSNCAVPVSEIGIKILQELN